MSALVTRLVRICSSRRSFATTRGHSRPNWTRAWRCWISPATACSTAWTVCRRSTGASATASCDSRPYSSKSRINSSFRAAAEEGEARYEGWRAEVVSDGVEQLFHGGEARLQLHRALSNLRLEQLAGAFFVRDIVRHLRKTVEGAALIPDGRDDSLDPKAGPVLAHAPTLVACLAFLGRRFEHLLGHAAFDVFGREEGAKRFSDDLVGPIALDALGPRVPGGDAAFGVQHVDRVALHTLHQQAKAFLAFPQGRLRSLALGDARSEREPGHRHHAHEEIQHRQRHVQFRERSHPVERSPRRESARQQRGRDR